MKYLKNDCLFKLYPAANIIGGRINVKKISSLNFKLWEKFAFKLIK